MLSDVDDLTVEPVGPDEMGAADALSAAIGGRWQARLGELHDVLALPGVIARRGDVPVGVATYRIDGGEAELAAIAVIDEHRRGGAGTALVAAVVAAAADAGARSLWLVTTNDNLDALRFYQRRDFRLAALHAGGVDRARQLKPEIPLQGSYGIAMRDEIVLRRDL